MNLPTRPTQEAFLESTADGHPLGGFTWRHPRTDLERPVVIINAATSVRCRHYSRFADYLFANGFNVITYDYRGIGESRSGSLHGFKAPWRRLSDCWAISQTASAPICASPRKISAKNRSDISRSFAASIRTGCGRLHWHGFNTAN